MNSAGGPETLPSLLVIMGSGETSPTMVKTHRRVFDRLGLARRAGVLIDTPFGFQENADDIVAKAQRYFSDSVGADIALARLRSVEEADVLETDRFLSEVRQAPWVFAGPGSPTYALAQWTPIGLAQVLADKLDRGGAITFSSAAALTLGAFTVPVYEVYKVGAKPMWFEGLDLVSKIGLRAAVIPHYDNAEGGNHDTRYCYLGERRLTMLEETLEGDAFVLGVDEHTGVVFDLDEGNATVVGRGGLSVRVKGRTHRFESGMTTTIATIADIAHSLSASPEGRHSATAPNHHHATRAEPGRSSGSRSPLVEAAEAQEIAFDSALGGGDTDRAVAAILDLEDQISAWSADTAQSADGDKARAALRSMIVRLGDVAARGVQDPQEVLAPYIQTLVDLRDRARDQRHWDEADVLRDRLETLGVEVRDGHGATTWVLADRH